MIWVDTSVRVDYLQRGNNRLAERLLGGLVCKHPYGFGQRSQRSGRADRLGDGRIALIDS